MSVTTRMIGLFALMGLAATGCGDKSDTVTDIDGNVYHTVTIGNQVWMAENLTVTHYRNGEDIPHVADSATWSDLTTGAYCEYDNDMNNVATYGSLYNWYAVNDSRNIAPAGWHVPTDAEWKQLEICLGMSQEEADAKYWRGDKARKLKQVGTAQQPSSDDGRTDNTDATNESGFTALPGGYRSINGAFSGMNSYTGFWSSTEASIISAWTRHLDYDSYNQSAVFRSFNFKCGGYSIRCLRDH